MHLAEAAPGNSRRPSQVKTPFEFTAPLPLFVGESKYTNIFRPSSEKAARLSAGGAGGVDVLSTRIGNDKFPNTLGSVVFKTRL